MLFYYHDYVSTDYIKNSFFVQNPKALHDYLISNFFVPDDNGYGQSIDEAVQRTTKYFNTHSINNAAYFTDYSSSLLYSRVYESIIMKGRPLIMCLYENEESISEWSINHAVVVHGLTDTSVYGQRRYAFYYVNDGWGHNNKAIFDSSAYISGLIRYKY